MWYTLAASQLEARGATTLLELSCKGNFELFWGPGARSCTPTETQEMLKRSADEFSLPEQLWHVEHIPAPPKDHLPFVDPVGAHLHSRARPAAAGGIMFRPQRTSSSATGPTQALPLGSKFTSRDANPRKIRSLRLATLTCPTHQGEEGLTTPMQPRLASQRV